MLLVNEEHKVRFVFSIGVPFSHQRLQEHIKYGDRNLHVMWFPSQSKKKNIWTTLSQWRAAEGRRKTSHRRLEEHDCVNLQLLSGSKEAKTISVDLWCASRFLVEPISLALSFTIRWRVSRTVSDSQNNKKGPYILKVEQLKGVTLGPMLLSSAICASEGRPFGCVNTASFDKTSNIRLCV